MSEPGYNERIFSKGLRSQLHFSRFHMLAGVLQRLDFRPKSVIELGCYDGKTIDYLPVKPSRYVGLDANWEGGLDLAKKRWRGEPGYDFIESHHPEDIQLDERFDLSVSMETLEHVPPEFVEPYLEKLAAMTVQYSFITVPNELGLVFAAKYAIKRLGGMMIEDYRISEVFHAALGRMEQVERNEHKGFDYREFIETTAKYFEILDVFPTPYRWMPLQTGFGICILGKGVL